MAHVVFYEKPGCGGNPRQKKWLQDAGHTLTVRDLLSEPWSAERLLDFLDPLPVTDWFNRAAPRIKQGEVVPESLERGEALRWLLAEPLLIRRPLLQVGDERRVGFDPAAIDLWIGLTPDAAARAQAAAEGCAAGPAKAAQGCQPPV
ncbi:ArsC/Spx/MgsR family protein [Methyloversatilis thermotolerans]|uniref:ArsC/Spx/MgsR family protein n=1 Tax=Methyloversatilis thermotolerans TaxID=1346290 RepID=UPI00035EB639|nr:ArsC/Spx/MgsR family protein [Methyloversatilis thermotolerans]